MEGELVTEDGLLGGRLRLLQPANGYRVAIDPVVLAATVAAGPGETVLDVGAGVGAAALCLAARVPDCRVTGVDVQRELVALASRNAALNGLEGRIDMLVADVARRPPPRLAPGTFNHVMTNPPHATAEDGPPPPDPSKAIANVESTADLATWLNFCLLMLRPKGLLTLVHRADRLGELLALLQSRAGEIVIFPLWPGQGRPARRVIVRCRKSVATPLRLMPGLVLHDSAGTFTPAAEAVLRHGAPLEM